MVPKFEWLEAFAEFGEDLNFTHAAARLHLSQPALHAQIAKLGEALDVKLYERRGRGLVLTDAGIETLRFARELKQRSSEFLAQVQGRQVSSPVVLAAGEGAFLYLLGAGIRAFVRRGPAPLRLVTRTASAAVEALQRGDAHVAVTVTPETPDGLEGVVLAEVPHVVVVREDHRLAGHRHIQTSALSGEALVVPPPGSPLRESLATSLASTGSQLDVAVEASGWEPILHFVGLGLGSAVVNGCCKPKRGQVAIPISDLPRIRYQLLNVAGARRDPRVAELIDILWRHRPGN